MRQAKELIDAFVREEYATDEGADYHDLSRVDIAYTTTSNGAHELQISADLLHFRLDTYIDNRLSASKQYQNLEDMVKNCLPYLDFHEMVADQEKVTIPKLMKKTGLSRGFFYKNPVVCNQRAPTDGFAEQNGRDAERADLTCSY